MAYLVQVLIPRDSFLLRGQTLASLMVGMGCSCKVIGIWLDKVGGGGVMDFGLARSEGCLPGLYSERANTMAFSSFTGHDVGASMVKGFF